MIGSGPAGQRAAIQGAKLDKKVAIVERKAVIGGCSVNLGTIPSKTLREAALELPARRELHELKRLGNAPADLRRAGHHALRALTNLDERIAA